MLTLTFLCSVFVAGVHVAALAGPCDPPPPTHPIPAAVEPKTPAVIEVPAAAPAPVVPAVVAPVEVVPPVHQEPASTPMTAPSAK
jgi:hypothetical protein